MIINFILITLLINQFLVLLIKPKNNILSCGIFAWAGKSVKSYNNSNFNILGIYNEERGRHSCGRTMDGEIEIGTGVNKVYKDFMETLEQNSPKKIPVVIGHTRHATYGLHTVANAHPFGFGFNKDIEGFEFIGVHNGTLINHEELAKKYKVNLDVFKKKGNSKKASFEREKIDSEVLLEILYKSKNYKVLKEYNGAAALVWTNTKEPNVIYCWHGKSKKYHWEQKGKEEEERPLFYWREHKNSLYISSIKNSLRSIGGNDDSIGMFDHNTVYKITNGDVNNAEKVIIDRNKNYTSKSTYNNSYNESGKNAYSQEQLCELFNEDPVGQTITLPANLRNQDSNTRFNIYNQAFVGDENKVCVHRLRYVKNNKFINGCYTLVPGYGFYYLNHDVKKAVEIIKGLEGCGFLKNSFTEDKNDATKPGYYIPFKVGSFKSKPLPIFYFFDGIRLVTSIDYITITQAKKDNREFSWRALSEAAAHPVIEAEKEFKDGSAQEIVYKGLLFTDTFTMLGDDRIYKVERGNCVKISPFVEDKKKNDKKEDKGNNFTSSKAVMQAIIDFNKEQNDDSNRPLKNVTNDLLEKDIEKIFTEPYGKFQDDIKLLKRYDHLERANEAIAILEDFILGCRDLVELEPKE